MWQLFVLKIVLKGVELLIKFNRKVSAFDKDVSEEGGLG